MASSGGFTFVAPQGSSQTQSQPLTIRNGGDGDLTWSATDDQSWLWLSATSGTAPTDIIITVDPTGLAEGDHTGTITINAPAATDAPKVVEVVLQITGAGETGQNAVYLPIILK